MTRASDHRSLAGVPLPLAARRILLFRLALAWERAWRAWFPLAGVCALFLGFALLGGFSALPGWIHVALLVGFAAGFGWAVIQGSRQFSWPSFVEVLRYVEVRNGLPHRPLSGFIDSLADQRSDDATLALWQEHRRRLQRAFKTLRFPWPSPNLPARDPYAIRFASALFVAVGVLSALDEGPLRILNALRPNFAADYGAVSLDAWIAPPAYTGAAPIFLTGEKGVTRSDRPFRVPIGSQLLAKLQGGRGDGAILLDGARIASFAAIDPGHQNINLDLRQGGKLVVEQGSHRLADWPLEIIPDLTPMAAFTDKPVGTPRAALKFTYRAEDDYGVSRLGVELKRDGGESAELPLSLPAYNRKTIADTVFLDIASHLWAGLEVDIRLFAEDAAGQRGYGEPATIKLPAREFRHPVARAIVEQRQVFGLSPEKRALVALALATIAELPETYRNDVTVRLALRTAEQRMLNENTAEARAAVVDLLWDTALKIEDGALSVAERDVRDAEQALQEALARGASDEEIERLLQQLQEALDKFTQSMIEQALREGRIEDEDPNQLRQEQMLTREDLRQMIERARDAARNGSRDAARDLLSQLRDMIENLKGGRIVRRQGPGGGAMQEMGEMVREQQQLLDRSFRRSQRGPGASGGEDGADDNLNGLGQRQETLRRRLGDMIRRFGENGLPVPGPLGQAERSMRDARDALNRQQPGAAVGPQAEALDGLREGARALSRQQTGEGSGEGAGNQRGRLGRNEQFDPLGRPYANDTVPVDGSETKVPGRADGGSAERAREILEELYRRAGDKARPELELQYLERLLKRF